jgi:hypothetical protein
MFMSTTPPTQAQNIAQSGEGPSPPKRLPEKPHGFPSPCDGIGLSGPRRKAQWQVQPKSGMHFGKEDKGQSQAEKGLCSVAP